MYEIVINIKYFLGITYILKSYAFTLLKKVLFRSLYLLLTDYLHITKFYPVDFDLIEDKIFEKESVLCRLYLMTFCYIFSIIHGKFTPNLGWIYVKS